MEHLDYEEFQSADNLDSFEEDPMDDVDYFDSSESMGYEWTLEDSWDALTDGMYGDYPGTASAWDQLYDEMGL